MAVQIQLRRDLAANWTSVNPTLASGEAGLETDTSKIKFGNGSTAWNSLPYFTGSGATAWGTITGTLTSQTDLSNALNAKSSVNAKIKVVRINPVTAAGEFGSIAAALATISDASPTNPYVVDVGPGVFVEPEFTVPANVSVRGFSSRETIISPDSNAHDCLHLAADSVIQFCTITNVGTGSAAIHVNDPNGTATIFKVIITDCDIGISFTGATGHSSKLNIGYVNITPRAGAAYGVYSDSNGADRHVINIENFYIDCTLTNPVYGIYLNGANTIFYTHASGLLGRDSLDGGTALHCSNGVEAYVKALTVNEWGTGIHCPATGSGVRLLMSGVLFDDNVMNFEVLNAADNGAFTGSSDFSKVNINPASSFFITNTDSNIITVAKKGGKFTSVKAALAWITASGSPSSTNRYEVLVGPGIFTEANPMVMPEWTWVVGSGDEVTTISGSNNISDLFTMADYSGIKLCTLTVPSQAADNCLVRYATTSATTRIAYTDRVRFADCDTISIAESNLGYTVLIHTGCKVGGGYTFRRGFICTGGAFEGRNVVFSSSSTGGIPSPYPEVMFESDSPLNEIIIQACTFYSSSTTTDKIFCNAYNGGVVRINGVSIKGFGLGLSCPNIGAGPELDINSLSMVNMTQDILIDHPDATGTINGAFDPTKVTVNPTSTVGMTYTAQGGTAGQVVLNNIFQGITHDTLVNLSEVVRDTVTLGVDAGGIITEVTGLQINVTAGTGYLLNGAEYLIKVSWGSSNLTLPANVTRFIEVDNTGTVVANAAQSDGTHAVTLGSVFTTATHIHYVENTPISSLHTVNGLVDMNRNALGVIYASGSIVSENGTTARNLDITGGIRYYGSKKFTAVGGTPVLFEEHYKNGSGGYVHGAANKTAVQNNKYDDGSGTLATVPAGKYCKHSLYVTGEGAYEQYLFVFSQAYYDTLIAAEGANIPTPPPEFRDSSALIASIITQEGVTNLREIRDERPVIGFKASGVSASADHRNLLELTNGDSGHTQFLMLNGSKPMSGDLDMGTHAISNVSLVDGVDVSAHEARHLPNGADPITTGTPSTIGTANAPGIQNALVRQDHVHDHGAQTVSTHHAVAATNAAGFMAAADKIKLDAVSTANYQQTSAMSLYQATSLMTNYELASHTSVFQQSSLMTNYELASHTSIFQQTSLMSNYDLKANSTLYVQTSVSSLFELSSHTTVFALSSNTSLFQQTSLMSNYELASHTSIFQQTSLMTNYFLADQTTKFAGTGTSATNASITMNSNGLAISVAAPGAGGGIAVSVNGANGSNVYSSGSLAMNAGANITLSTGAGAMTIIGPSPAGGAGSVFAGDFVSLSTAGANTTVSVINLQATSLMSNYDLIANSTLYQPMSQSSLHLQTSQSSLFQLTSQMTAYPGLGTSATNASITLNTNGLAISVAAPGGGAAPTLSYYCNMGLNSASNALAGIASSNGTMWMFPMQFNDAFPGNMTISTLQMLMGASNSTATASLAKSFTVDFGIYTVNGSSLSLVNSVRSAWTHSNDANASQSYAGTRFWSVHSSQWSSQPVLSAGIRYYGGMRVQSSGNAFQTYSLYGQFNLFTIARSGSFGVVSQNNTSMGIEPFAGIYSSATGGYSTALPGNIPRADINKQSASANFVPLIIMNNLMSSY